MDSERVTSRGAIRLAVDLDPETADAGADIFVDAAVLCDPPCDLRGHTLKLEDESGSTIATLVLAECDGGLNEAGIATVKAPLDLGDYRWSVIFPGFESDGVSYEETSANVEFSVKAHTTQIVAWGYPPAIVAGERFRLKIGVKCSAECDFSYSAFAVIDHEGRQVASSALSGDVWRGTKALHYTALELQAPDRPGLYRWQIAVPVADRAIPHSEGHAEFGIRIVAKPEHVVRIEAVSVDTKAPLPGALVTMHPYKAVADENGVATFSVAKGNYRLFVAKAGYVNFVRQVKISGDVSIKAELAIELIEERN